MEHLIVFVSNRLGRAGGTSSVGACFSEQEAVVAELFEFSLLTLTGMSRFECLPEVLFQATLLKVARPNSYSCCLRQ